MSNKNPKLPTTQKTKEKRRILVESQRFTSTVVINSEEGEFEYKKNIFDITEGLVAVQITRTIQ